MERAEAITGRSRRVERTVGVAGRDRIVAGRDPSASAERRRVNGITERERND